MLSATLRNLLKLHDLGGADQPQIQPIDNDLTGPPQTSDRTPIELTQDSHSTHIELTQGGENKTQSEFANPERPVFIPLLHPERLCNVEDEYSLRQFVSQWVSGLTDEELKQKISVYQKLGVLVRICESESHKVGITRNKKFLEHNEEKSYLKLRSPVEQKEKPTTDKLTDKQKLVNKLIAKGKDKNEAIKIASAVLEISDPKEKKFVERMALSVGISPAKASAMFRAAD